MRRIRDYAAIFVFAQFISFLFAANLYPQSDAEPIGWWQFDEAEGSSVGDASGNGNTGRVTGAEWVKGEHGVALMFDGQDDCVWCGQLSPA